MKLSLSKIDTIIFDLGNVLLNLDFDASIKAFHELGLNDDLLNRKQVYTNPVFYDFEIGEVSEEEFRTQVRKILKNPNAIDKQIDDAWCAMIGDIPASRVKTLMKLGDKYNICLFSNTNSIHIRKLLFDFVTTHGVEFTSLFDHVFYSHQINARKPDLGAYEKVIELSGVIPAKTLFVDDLEKNIEGAAKAGLKTLWLKSEMEMSDLF